MAYKLEAVGLNGVDLEPSNGSIGPGNYSDGDVLRVGFTLRNLGTAQATSVGYDLTLGLLPAPDPANDLQLGTFTAPNLNAGAAASLFQQLTLPTGLPTGNLYLHLTASAAGEANAANNTTSIPITIVP